MNRDGVKVALVGAGSPYALDVIDSFLSQRRWSLRELLLVDPDGGRVTRVADFAHRRASELGIQVEVGSVPSVDASIGAVDFVVSMFRGGGQQLRHREELRARAHGLLAQETHGWVGLVGALANVPLAQLVGRTLADCGSSAWHIVVSNPLGVVTRAARYERPARTIGVCDMPAKTVAAIAGVVGCAENDLEVEYLGLNHLGWVTRAESRDGEDLLGPLLASNRLREVLEILMPEVGSEVDLICRAAGGIPNPYLRYIYGTRASAPSGSPTRAEQCMTIDDSIFSAVDACDIAAARVAGSRRGGWGIGHAVTDFISGIASGQPLELIASGYNGSTLPFLAEDAVIEVRRTGEVPMPVKLDIHPHIRGLIAFIADYEAAVAASVAHDDMGTLLAAAAMNPWIGSSAVASALFGELFREHRVGGVAELAGTLGLGG